jgi:thioesterase domain-containing protein
VQDSFFDLGGHSLIAVRLFAKIKKTLQVEFPISVLFEAPTIESCAALIRKALGDTDRAAQPTEDRHRTRFTHLVAMHPGSERATTDRIPFFLVAGMFGNVLNLRHLAHLIGTDRRFFGLQARGLYGDHTPHETFEAMAVDYLAELRTVQPKGPYILGGFSGGGLAAYEMARQLRAVGEEVALLVLLDTPLPLSPPLTGRDKVTMHLQQFRARGPAHLLQWAKARYTWETQKRRTRQQNGNATHRPFDFHSEAVEAAFRRALDRYELKPSPEKVALFRPKLDKAVVLGPGRVINRERRFIFEDNGWSPYVKSIEVFEVPGDHDSVVLEPNVRVLAARLHECIERSEHEIGGMDRVRLVPDLPLKASGPEAGAAPTRKAVEASAE